MYRARASLWRTMKACLDGLQVCGNYLIFNNMPFSGWSGFFVFSFWVFTFISNFVKADFPT